MPDQKSTSPPLEFERISASCLAFHLNHGFVSDNNFLFVAPNDGFCRACFKRRYLTQMMGELRVIQIYDNVLALAKKLDVELGETGVWLAYSVNEQKPGLSFELTPYEDCPFCGKAEVLKRSEVALEYRQLLAKETTPRLESLKQQVFSFGFTNRCTLTNKTGLPNPEFDRLLGAEFEARITFRMMAPDGRFADDAAVGTAKNKDLAELKALMEYLERYAFMLQLCRFRTNKYDDQIIYKTLALYRKPLSATERKCIRQEAAWAINLISGDIKAIPLSFIFNKGEVRQIVPVSSGFAAHTDFRKSLCGSILELIERDAYMRFWFDPQRAYEFFPEKAVDVEVKEIISTLKLAVNNSGMRGQFYVLASPTRLPVVLITISSQDIGQAPSLNFGCGVGFSLDDAISGAMEELRHNTLNLVKGVTCIQGFVTRRFNQRVQSIPDRMNLYSTSQPRAKLKFLDMDNPLVDGVIEEAKIPDLDVLIERFRCIDFDIYGLDCTPRCFSDKNVYVTRAFSPQLYPVQFEQEGAFKIKTSQLSAHKELPHFFL